MFDLLWLVAFVGSPVVLGAFHAPILWLLAVAVMAGLIPTSVNITRLNLLATEWRSGRRVSPVMLILVVPALVNAAIMAVLYGIAWLIWP